MNIVWNLIGLSILFVQGFLFLPSFYLLTIINNSFPKVVKFIAPNLALKNLVGFVLMILILGIHFLIIKVILMIFNQKIISGKYLALSFLLGSCFCFVYSNFIKR
jgi:hypothetical protein